MSPKRQGKSKEDVAAEKKRVERLKQLEAERELNLKRLETETKENSLRNAMIGESMKKFDELLRKVRAVKKISRDDSAGEKYLKCNKLPDTNVPAEVRGILYMWRESLKKHWAEQINWWLKCNDRSVLTQDPSVEDERRVLIKKLREKTGKFYDLKLRELMKLYNSLMESLRRRLMTESRFEDLITIRDEIRETAFKFLDVLTLEVTMHIDREMNSISPWTASYSLATPDFVKYVWAFKDVPKPRDMKPHVINMEPLNLIVRASSCADLTDASLRGLWCKRDFLSDYCPTFYAPIESSFESLKSALVYERHQRSLMTERHLIEMKAARDDWEKKMETQLLAEAMNKGSKGKKPEPKKQPEKKSSKSKLIIEPPVVDEATYVDVEEEYCAQELDEYNEERKSLLPENLGLRPGEVNMRENQISNGILEIEAFEKPLQTMEINPTIFIRINENPKVLRIQDFHQTFELPKMSRKSQFGKKPEDLMKEALDKLVRIEIKLSEKLFWFEAPTVCRWVPWEESDEFNELDEDTKHFNLRYDEYVKDQQSKLFSAPDPGHHKKVLQLEDFDLNSLDRTIRLADLFKHYIVPMMPDEYKCFNEQMEIFEKKQHEWQLILDAKKRTNTYDELALLFEETGMKFNVNTITREEFDKLYDDKLFHPRNLFPKEHQNMIEVLKGSSDSLLNEKLVIEEKVRAENVKMDPNAPLLLSELVKQIESVKESLRPFFRAIPEKLPLIEIEKPKFKSTQLTWKENRASRLSRMFRDRERVSRRSTRTRSKSRILKSTSSESTPKSNVSSSESSKPIPKSSPQLIRHYKGKWSTKDIYEKSYDKDTKTLTFYAGRLGTFGLATRKYVNFPLKSWEMFPVIESTNRFVKLRIETQHITIEFDITDLGYTFKITSPRKVPFYEITIPVKINELKKLLTSLNLNLFPEIDASCYIQEISEKHKPMELHTYKSMAVYCLSHHFKWSVWNRFAGRRVAVFESGMIKKSDFNLIMVTPLKTASVNIRERCTPLDVVELDYEMVPPNQEFHPDLLDFLKEQVDLEERRRNEESFMMTWFVQALLMNIQPLSFSR